MINITKQANQILNIVKARRNLKDKSEAIEYIALNYGEELLEPELRPEFIAKMRKLQKEKGISFKNIIELRESIEKSK